MSSKNRTAYSHTSTFKKGRQKNEKCTKKSFTIFIKDSNSSTDFLGIKSIVFFNLRMAELLNPPTKAIRAWKLFIFSNCSATFINKQNLFTLSFNFLTSTIEDTTKSPNLLNLKKQKLRKNLFWQRRKPIN